MPEPVVTTTPADTSSTVSTTTTPAVTTPAVTTTPAKFSYDEDRSSWVSPDKHRAAERVANGAVTRAQQLEAQIAERDRKIAALAGVTQPDPDEAELGKVREGFAKLYPNLARMAELDPQKLERILAQGDQAEHVVRHHWDAHRDATLTDLKSRVATAMNLSDLSKTAAAKVVAAFKSSIPDPNDDPDGYARWSHRYEQKDPTLLDEFVQEFVGDFITPAQRTGLVRPRIAVPSGGNSRPVAMNQNPKPEFSKMKSVPEMLAAAEEAADAHYGH